MNILVNALGISDSGGIYTLDKVCGEFISKGLNKFIIICNESENIRELEQKYKELNFILIKKSLLYRLFYENIIFRSLVKRHNIQLIYNFTGSAQFNFLINTLQMTKLQDMTYYSSRLDYAYRQENAYFKWLKQVFFKRIFYIFMLKQSKFIEVQSNHVQLCLSDFMNTKNNIFFLKSDIDVSSNFFSLPREYNFSQKIKFLYIVGPHFEVISKNFIIFTNAMLSLQQKDINFEINITLTSEQANHSKLWSPLLNKNTNFIGYVNEKQKMKDLFCDNSILISTSIVETLGLHVIDGIKNGVITIVPDEEYSNAVYGENMFKFKLYNKNSLLQEIMSVLDYKESFSKRILSLQDELKKSEEGKYTNILDLFDEVINV